MPQIDIVIFNTQAFWLLFLFIFIYFFFKQYFFVFAFFFFFLRSRNIEKFLLVLKNFELFNWLYIAYLFGASKLFNFLLSFISTFFVYFTLELLLFTKFIKFNIFLLNLEKAFLLNFCTIIGMPALLEENISFNE